MAPTGAAAAAAAAAPGLSPADVHVLLVDDDRVPRMVVAGQLKKFQYKGEREGEEGREGTARPREFALLRALLPLEPAGRAWRARRASRLAFPLFFVVWL